MKIGVVGAGGYWGPNWVRVLKHLRLLHALCDVDRKRLAAVSERLKIGPGDTLVTTDQQTFLNSGLDGVVVVTPPQTHADVAIAVLECGAHVLIEKPLAHTVMDARRIAKAASGGEHRVMVGHTYVYHPSVRKFREALPMVGELRTILTVRASFGRYQRLGIALDLLPHDISIFNYLCGCAPEGVSLTVNRQQDVGFFRAIYGDVECNAFLGWAYPDKTRKLVAVGSRGILEWDLNVTHLVFHEKWVEGSFPDYKAHHDGPTRNVMVHDQTEALVAQCLHFADCIEKGVTPLTGLEDGLRVVEAIQHASQ